VFWGGIFSNAADLGDGVTANSFANNAYDSFLVTAKR
jgi:hypothetical protein